MRTGGSMTGWGTVMVAGLGLLLAGCPKEADEAAPAAGDGQQPAGGQQVVAVDSDHPGPKVMRNGKPGKLVDMRVRAKLVRDGVQPSAEAASGWEADGDWKVFEIPYRDGDLKFELAIEVRRDEAAGDQPTGQGRLLWLEGDPAPFLQALAYIFGTSPPRVTGRRGDALALQVKTITTEGRDTGKVTLDKTGGGWIVCRIRVPGPQQSEFDLKLLPARGLARIAPVSGQPSGPVIRVFAEALEAG